MVASDKIKAVMQLTNTTQLDIAKRLNMTQSNVSRMLKFGDSMRIDHYKQIVGAIGGTVEINIVLPDGTKI